MKAEVTFSELYWNESLMSFFFREQSIRTLDELLEKVADKRAAINAIEVHAEINNYSVDDLEEMFYEYSIEELADEFGLELESDDEE